VASAAHDRALNTPAAYNVVTTKWRRVMQPDVWPPDGVAPRAELAGHDDSSPNVPDTAASSSLTIAARRRCTSRFPMPRTVLVRY
jgi:hypothetical protein